MQAFEFTTDEIKTIIEALEYRVTAYKLQHTNCVPLGVDRSGGENWIKRYATSVKKITSKLEKGLEVTIHIRYNEESSRYDWAIDEEGCFVYRIGLKDLDETMKWLKNEKLQNPFVTFVVDKSKT